MFIVIHCAFVVLAIGSGYIEQYRAQSISDAVSTLCSDLSPHTFQFTSSSHLSPSNLFNVPRCKDDSYLLLVWNKTIAPYETLQYAWQIHKLYRRQSFTFNCFAIISTVRAFYWNSLICLHVEIDMVQMIDVKLSEFIRDGIESVHFFPNVRFAFLSKRSFFENIFVIFHLTQVSSAYSNMSMFDLFFAKIR